MTKNDIGSNILPEKDESLLVSESSATMHQEDGQVEMNNLPSNMYYVGNSSIERMFGVRL